MRTWIEVSRNALCENIRSLRALCAPGVTFCAVVKANAYGHGIAPVASVCVGEGIDHFAVDSIEEAEMVRTIAGESATIFLLGNQDRGDFDRVVAVGAIQTVSLPEDVTLLAQSARRVGRPAQITCEIETGLHRLGASDRVVTQIIREVERWKGYVYVQSLASHFASSEQLAAQWETKRQNTTFCDAIEKCKEHSIFPPYKHISCSAATLLYPEFQHSLVRFGIMLYGLWPSFDVRRQGTLGKRFAQLSPVLSMKTRLVHIQDIKTGETVGYGGAFVANRPMRIGVIPMGYYDGFDRRGSGQGNILVRGTKCPILGTVCMNMCMVDIGGAPPATGVGDVVTLLGRDGLGVITADDLAQAWGTIHYEVVTRLAAHIPRVLV